VSVKYNIPNEIVEFFNKEGGRSLLIKGGAGTGKTTFALQLLEEMCDPDHSFYLSTRVSDESLYNMFPWLREKEMRTRIVDASRMFLQTIYQKDVKEEKPKLTEEELKRIRGARDFLKSIVAQKSPVPTTVDRSRLSALLEHYTMPEIVSVYNRVEEKLPNKTLFVMDSVEGLTTKYKIDPEELISALQKDLVENSNTNLVLVLEKDLDSHLDYLVDGVISLSRSEIEGRRIREVRLEKLRATEIRQPRYITSLIGGRFKSFEPLIPNIKNTKQWEPLPDKPGYYSTGIPDLDNLLGGGFKKGSYNIIEVAETVNTEEFWSILRPIMLNFVNQSRGIVMVPSGGDSAEALRIDMTKFMRPEIFDMYVRVVDYFAVDSPHPYVLAVGSKDFLKNWKNVQSHLRGPSHKPIMDFTSFDTLEYLKGNDIAVKDLFVAVAALKVSEDIGIGLMKPGLKLTQEIMNMADTYLKIMSINKSTVIYGIKPHTILYVITTDPEKGYPHVKLTPIV